MAISRYGWRPWILVPTWYPPSIFTNFSWAKSHTFFIMEKPKFTEIFNICWKHVPFILCRSSQFDQMSYISVNFDFCITKKLWDLAHEKLVNVLGGHHVGTNILGCQPAIPGNCHLCNEISKRRTIMQATVYTTVHIVQNVWRNNIKIIFRK